MTAFDRDSGTPSARGCLFFRRFHTASSLRKLAVATAAGMTMVLAATAHADAPNVDCNKPRAATVEKFICDLPELSALDVQMAKRYGDTLAKVKPSLRKTLQTEQQRWIRSRNRCAKSSEPLLSCVTSHYEARMNRLDDFAAVFAARGDPFAGAAPVMYVCEDRSVVTATFAASNPPKARVKHGDSQWDLPQQPSGSGTRYDNGEVAFREHAGEATLEQAGKSLQCKAGG